MWYSLLSRNTYDSTFTPRYSNISTGVRQTIRSWAHQIECHPTQALVIFPVQHHQGHSKNNSFITVFFSVLSQTGQRHEASPLSPGANQGSVGGFSTGGLPAEYKTLSLVFNYFKAETLVCADLDGRFLGDLILDRSLR